MLSLKTAKKKSKKCFDVLIKACDAEMIFSVKLKSKGQELLNLTCETLGLREVWYFGIQFKDIKDDWVWLVGNKQVLKHKVKQVNPKEFNFMVKFYPENICTELIQDQTVHIFYSVVQHDITNKDLYKRLDIKADILMQLMALEVQTKVACYIIDTSNREQYVDQIFQKYRIIRKDNHNIDLLNEECSKIKMLSKVEAELEYLKIVQQHFKCFGVSYFNIKRNKRDNNLLGITSRGVNVYEQVNPLDPIIVFAWNEINNVSFSDKKFTIRMMDRTSPDFTFFVDQVKTNKMIIELCMGNHELFMKRRKPDTMEVQQMRVSTLEERRVKALEREMIMKERASKEMMERRLEEQRDVVDRLQRECSQLQQQLLMSQEALVQSDQSCDLLSERVMLLEEEVKLLNIKIKEQQLELHKSNINCIQMEQERIAYERRALEAEILASQVVEECDRRSKEADQLRLEMMEVREEEMNISNKYRQLLQLSVAKYPKFASSDIEMSNDDGDKVRYGGLRGIDVTSLTREIDNDRYTHLEKTKHLQQKLKNLKSEIEVLKIEKASSSNNNNNNNNINNINNNNISNNNSNNNNNNINNIINIIDVNDDEKKLLSDDDDDDDDDDDVDDVIGNKNHRNHLRVQFLDAA